MDRLVEEVCERYRKAIASYRAEVAARNALSREEARELTAPKKPHAHEVLDGVALTPDLASALHDVVVQELHDHVVAKERNELLRKLAECPCLDYALVSATDENDSRGYYYSSKSCISRDCTRKLAQTLACELRALGWSVSVKLCDTYAELQFQGNKPSSGGTMIAIEQPSSPPLWVPLALLAIGVVLALHIAFGGG